MKRLFLLLAAITASCAPARADLIKLSSAYTRTVLMTSSSNHITGATGLTLTIALSKAGGAPATITPTVTEIGSGRYAISLTSANTNTLGALDMTITATGADPGDTHDQVVAFDPGDAAALGLSSISGIKTQTDKMQFDASNYVKSNAQTVQDKTGYTASTVSDKTGYSLANSQTFSTSGSVGSVTGAVGSVTGNVIVGDYATGHDPATLIGILFNSAAPGSPTAGSPYAQWGTAATQATAAETSSAANGTAIAALPGQILLTPSNKLATDSSGNVSLSAATLTNIANAVLGAQIDGSITMKQKEELALSILAGRFSSVTSGGTVTTTYYKQDGTTVIAIAVSSGTPVVRTWTFSNL